MLRLRLGLHVGPFIVTSEPRRRARVPSMPRVALRVWLFVLAAPAGVALAWWWSR